MLDELGAYVIADLQALARSMREAGERVIDFSIGDPREPTPPFIPEALKAAVPAVSQYPTVAGIAELRSAFAGYLSRRFGVAVDPDTQVIPTSGSKEAIFTTPFAFVDAAGGDAAGFGTPGYPVYERGTRFAGAEALGIRLTGDFVLRASDVPDDAWERLRILWICSPHNPTGSVTGPGTSPIWWPPAGSTACCWPATSATPTSTRASRRPRSCRLPVPASRGRSPTSACRSDRG